MPSIRLIRIDDELRRSVETSPESFARSHGACMGEHEPVIREVISQTLALLARVPRAPEWGGYLVSDDDQAAVIGTCGFAHGPEADGTVEIAYFTFPAFEGRGYATAMAGELLQLALRSGTDCNVVAHTLPEHNASTRVLAKVGLQFVGEAQDADVGKVWRWAYRAPHDREPS